MMKNASSTFDAMVINSIDFLVNLTKKQIVIDVQCFVELTSMKCTKYISCINPIVLVMRKINGLVLFSSA